ncbi:DUF2007 domain-containing protein [Flavobacterium agricola]|uniref:DUF2007 domain-containing protein n=1 Tax=Flavobacterium agricola TaxID=2870839 RepID=A0ABY6LZX7_9FLAO|nr:DUF2007 domain-containing protein [Flavobacterium agricola]UYW01849.1 DUF2007 domain-containing protein [Flavobacterium agricola]
MDHVQVYSGSEVSALAVKNALENNKIEFIERDDINSGIVSGFGTLGKATNIFVLANDAEKAKEIISSLNL